MERLKPISSKKEISVDIEVARIIAADFCTKSVLNISLVQIFADPAKSRVAEIAIILTLAADVINVLIILAVHATLFLEILGTTYLTSLLVWANQSIVAVDACRNTRPNALAIIAVLDKTLATGKSILHGLTFASIENGWVATLTTGHWLVVFILGQAIGKTVSNKNRLQVDVSLLVGKNLRCENWDIVTGI
jgi:hypothetical protein